MSQISDLSLFVSDALKVVEFKLARDRRDVEDESTSFHPDMAHQIFGDQENIFGYRDLKIRLYYTAGPMDIYFGFKYNSKVDDNHSDGVKADDISSQVMKILPDGCHYTNIDEFLLTLDKSENFKPFGEKVDGFEVATEGQAIRTFEIYRNDTTTPKFVSFFTRLESLILWFIDAASYIDVDDPQWVFFICYEKFKTSKGDSRWATVGYSTVYQYYAYPENTRSRISQVFILPPFQRLGLGTRLIEAIYHFCIANTQTVDITVESPSDEFQRIRNYVDVKMCQSLPAFAADKLRDGFSSAMIEEARAKVKINRIQCRRVYEILRLMHTNVHNNSEYRAYRLDIKKRLDRHHQKHKSELVKIEKRGVNVTTAVAALPTVPERWDQLNEAYKDLENEYFRVINRVKA